MLASYAQTSYWNTHSSTSWCLMVQVFYLIVSCFLPTLKFCLCDLTVFCPSPLLDLLFSVQLTRCLGSVDPRLWYFFMAMAGLGSLYVGIKTSWIVIFVLSTCLSMLGFAGYLCTWVLAKDEGTPDMREVIKRGSHKLADLKVHCCVLGLCPSLVLYKCSEQDCHSPISIRLGILELCMGLRKTCQTALGSCKSLSPALRTEKLFLLSHYWHYWL